MKRAHKYAAVLTGLCLCLASAPVLPVSAAPTLAQVISQADAAQPDYRIRMLEFPRIDRSDLLAGRVYKLADNRYALAGWGYFHAEDYKNTPQSRGPYYAGTAVVDRNGEIIVPWQPTMVNDRSWVAFEDGVYSVVYEKIWDGVRYPSGIRYNTSEYYDAEGNILFAHEPFAAAGVMRDGMAWVAYLTEDPDTVKVQLIDKTGAVLADLPERKYHEIHDFSEGLARYCFEDENGELHYGYFDRTGKTVLESEYPCGDFHNGLAWVMIGKKYGFMDTAGKLVIPAEYDALGDQNGFTAEALFVSKEKHWALMDQKGEFLTDFVYTMSPRPILEMEYTDWETHVYDAGQYVFTDGYIPVYRDGTYCLLDTRGKEHPVGSRKVLKVFGNGLFGAADEERMDYFDSPREITDIDGNTILDTVMYSNVYLGSGVFYVFNDSLQSCFEIEPAAEASIIPGDVTGDGITDIMDAILLNKHLLGAKELDSTAKKAADLNRDDQVDAQDSLSVLKEVLGIRE